MNRDNNPFLQMLAAIEDGLEAGPPIENVAQHTQRSGNVKLPDYWPGSPGIWFARVELRFEVCGIVSEREKFAHTANALTQEASRLVTDLIISPPAERPYTILKERLLMSHQLTPVQKAMRVMAMPAIGDRRPSQLLADMLEYCPTEEEKSAFFRAAFIQRLPAELQVLLDGVEDGDLKDLAAKADKLWAIRRPSGLHMAAISQHTEDSGEQESGETVAAIKPAPKGKPQYKGRRPDGRQKQPPRMFTICFKHMKYGADAFSCDDPTTCKWAGN